MNFRKFCEEEWGGASFIGTADTILNTPESGYPNSRYLGPGNKQSRSPNGDKLFKGKKKKFMGKEGDDMSKVEKLFKLEPTYVIKNMKKKS